MRLLYTGRHGRYIAAEYNKAAHEEKDNIAALKAFADRGARITLLGVANVERVRTADCIMDGTLWEVKTNRTPTVSAIDNALRSCNGQAENLVLNVLSDITEELLVRGFWTRIHRTDLEQIVVERNGKIVRTYSRGEILRRQK